MLLNVIQKLTRRLWRKASNQVNADKTALTPALAKVVKISGYLPPLTALSPFIFRKLLWCLERPFNVDKPKLEAVKEYQYHVSNSQTMRLRCYYPEGSSTRENIPALVYFHGGGLVIGSIGSHDLFCRYVASSSNVAVISVDYRLAPEHKFPVPVEDAIKAWNWVCQHSQTLNIDINNLGVGGDSAGGFLATSVVLQYLKPALKVKPSQMPAFQWLLYPMLDMRCNTDSYERCNSGMLLTKSLMLYFKEYFLSKHDQVTNPVISPLLTNSYEGSPPSYLLTVYHDPLMDEGQTYGKRLAEQGIKVVEHHHTDLYHGFISYGGICSQAKFGVDGAIEELKALFQTSRQDKNTNNKARELQQ